MHEAAEWLCSEHDAIIGHSVHYPVQTAAEKAGKPYATVMMNHAAVYSKHSTIYGVPNFGRWMNPYWNKLFHWAMDRSIGVNVNALRKRVGLPPVTKIADTVWISRRLNLIAETRAIGRKQPDWPDSPSRLRRLHGPERSGAMDHAERADSSSLRRARRRSI